MELQAIFNIIIILIILGLFKFFFPSFITQFAKDLATKKNLEDITKIVEDIKQQNNKELEFIKSELSVKTKAQQAIYDDERKAIVEFMTSCIILLTTHFNIPKIMNLKDGLNLLIEKDKLFSNDVASFQLNAAKLPLFCFNESLLMESIKLASLLTKMIKNVRNSRDELYIIHKTFLEKNNDEDFSDTNKAIIKLIDDFNKTLEVFNQDFIPLYKNLSITCKNYLKEKNNIK